MAHTIHVIIGEDKIIKEIAEEWIGIYVELDQGISLIPLTEQLYDDIEELSNLKNNAWPFDDFIYLSKSVFELLKSKSLKGKIGYLETDYFGGTGIQRAILLDREKVVIGPVKTETKWDQERHVTMQIPPGERAINQVLKALGVSKKNLTDEFQAIGLENLRSNEKIIEKYSHR